MEASRAPGSDSGSVHGTEVWHVDFTAMVRDFMYTYMKYDINVLPTVLKTCLLVYLVKVSLQELSSGSLKILFFSSVC